MARQPSGVSMLDRDSAGIALRAELEERHWWLRGRRKVLAAALARVAVPAPCEALDLGCGTGSMLRILHRFGPVSGIDVNPEAVERARQAGVGEVREGTLTELPYEDGHFGLVTCLDALEHVEDDARALAEARRVTSDDGILLVAAPAYPRLFSAHDVAAGHFRRYSMRGLRELAAASGWCRVYATHFNSLLLPVAATRRLLTRSAEAPRSELLATPPVLDRPLYAILRFEAYLIRAGIRLPAGLSIVAAFRRS